MIYIASKARRTLCFYHLRSTRKSWKQRQSGIPLANCLPDPSSGRCLRRLRPRLSFSYKDQSTRQRPGYNIGQTTIKIGPFGPTALVFLPV